MLLWHHLFYNNPKTFDRFTSLYAFSNGVPAEVYISVFCKLCVAIFVFLSGYGLYCSFNKYFQKNLGEGTKYLIFSFKYSVLIFVVLTVICLVIAIALEWIKNIIGYNKLFNFLTKKIIKQ